MNCDEWLQQFEDELKKLRPRVGGRLATTLALQAYDEKEHPALQRGSVFSEDLPMKLSLSD